ncbi:MAG: site-specific integrase [Cytophagales bacterium]|nr:site-specific integrase [Cytophagales bacterium]
MHKNSTSLHSQNGQRKYLNQTERLRFLEVTQKQQMETKLFCQLLCYTGARIAEIHNLMVRSIDFSNQAVIIESLKKRQKGVYREIPLPDFLLNDLMTYIEQKQLSSGSCLWPFSLRTASRQIKRTMKEADIQGVCSSAKGLRHGFAVHAVSIVPLTLVKKWLGHAKLETTEIYLNIIGKEEREIAKLIW